MSVKFALHATPLMLVVLIPDRYLIRTRRYPGAELQHLIDRKPSYECAPAKRKNITVATADTLVAKLPDLGWVNPGECTRYLRTDTSTRREAMVPSVTGENATTCSAVKLQDTWLEQD